MADYDLVLERFCKDTVYSMEALDGVKEILTNTGQDGFDARLDKFAECNPNSSLVEKSSFDLIVDLFDSKKS